MIKLSMVEGDMSDMQNTHLAYKNGNTLQSLLEYLRMRSLLHTYTMTEIANASFELREFADQIESEVFTFWIN